MKTELQQLIEEISNEYESNGMDIEDQFTVYSRHDIINRIKALHKEYNEPYLTKEDQSLIRDKINYWNRIAKGWKE
jgi:hypothetical protein